MERTAVAEADQTADTEDSGKLMAESLAEHGEVMLPMVELLEQGRLAAKGLVGNRGRGALEAAWELER